MERSVIVAGFGGQGVMFLGQVLSLAAMFEGKHVTWLPSYGPEMRGGTANCTVVISDDEVASPVVDKPMDIIVMNIPSLLKFEKIVKEGGYIFMNTSVIDKETQRKDVEVVKVEANKIAEEIGSSKIANMVMLGVYVAKTKVVKPESVFEAIRKKSKKEFIDMNIEAVKKGLEFLRS
ncbi:MAG: 2-oxoacid:ferredoxin oxidoreductase subunit gamma [Thermotoga sp.]|nr:MAG: 2-oxoacid:ferredoxin oxidoreductase subunit gamma [Thermotoga sp.]HDM69837.1 2-oxoacid:ferredoxin oxidoreductase subunit gamma [Thermotogales bacterium]